MYSLNLLGIMSDGKGWILRLTRRVAPVPLSKASPSHSQQQRSASITERFVCSIHLRPLAFKDPKLEVLLFFQLIRMTLESQRTGKVTKASASSSPREAPGVKGLCFESSLHKFPAGPFQKNYPDFTISWTIHQKRPGLL
ncbi:hypothetical protein FQA47_021990 [Oryzias melastigma]|uniref:Uncharacterized protein n=1 Tax=Oryzias melastigma TaxID=30732 RepID=A0A834L1R0_ORYME|nr:hypothetical protein FQA47_021990 [Oryzias melastigma]